MADSTASPRRTEEARDFLSVFAQLQEALLAECRRHYAANLVSVAVFGSVGRGTPRPDSDIDILIVAEGLPDGRMRRSRDFESVETAMGSALERAALAGVHTSLAPVFKTPAEARAGSPLFLDMIDDARLLEDRNHFLRQLFDRFRGRLTALGARRVWRGNAWFWDLKPDYRPGDEFEL